MTMSIDLGGRDEELWQPQQAHKREAWEDAEWGTPAPVRIQVIVLSHFSLFGMNAPYASALMMVIPTSVQSNESQNLLLYLS
jgi:hypothetical protein